MTDSDINSKIHPIRLEFEIAQNAVKAAKVDYEYVIREAQRKNSNALIVLSKYRDIYEDEFAKYKKCEERFVKLGGKVVADE